MTLAVVKHIVVVGGGSAGWITAGSLAAEFKSNAASGIKVTLIESPDVKIIGVGEGTWPSMRTTLKHMGIAETDFLSHCHASFKQGSKFIGWRNGHADDSYYHPFTTPPGYTEVDLYRAWQSADTGLSFADTVCAQSPVCEASRAPKQAATPDYAGVTNYGYHLDAGRFADLLQRHCVEKLGVRHVLDHVQQVQTDPEDYITSIGTRNSGPIAGDLFIDCTGVQALLLGGHYQVPFLDKQDILFNDTALAMQVPYAKDSDPIASATLSTAQEAGWIWDIGLPSRRGIGHVFSSAHSDSEQAERALRAHVANLVGETTAEQLAVRQIRFRPGHREKFWHKNCLAIGMSSGFLEPLEASALALVELSVAMLKDELPTDRTHMEIVAQRFNQRFRYRWDRVIEFLKLHYVLSHNQSQYWRDNLAKDSIPDRLQELLQLWRYQPPSRHDFIQNEEVFPSASYQYVLYGMGFSTQMRPTDHRFFNMQRAQQLFSENQARVQQYLSGLPENRSLLDTLCRRHQPVQEVTP